MCRKFAISLVLFAVCAIAAAQTSQVDTSAYDKALARPRLVDRITDMEIFATNHRGSPLALDALQLLVWWNLDTGGRTRAVDLASQLTSVDTSNVVALAVLANDRRIAAESGIDAERNAAECGRLAEKALAEYASMRRPKGVSDAEFYATQARIRGLALGASGYAAYVKKDYEAAQPLLREAVKADPDSPTDVYALALSELLAKKPNYEEGFWYLARAVVLNQGTAAGQQIAAFAAEQYQDAGGTARDWEQFVVAARSTQLRPGAGANALALAKSGGAAVASAKPADQQVSSNKSGKPRKPDEPQPKDRKQTEQAANVRPDVPPLPPAPRTVETPPASPKYKRPATGAPVSMGILIEASGIAGDKQSTVVQGLTEIMDQLRSDDEAFILTYGNDLVIEQDLTRNPRLLQDAMMSLSPRSGSALVDAVSVSAAHLKRIAKNQNRILLVVSDGQDRDSKQPAWQLASSLREVTIFCIGVNVDTAEGQSLLKALASRTGGQAAFTDTRHFEIATASLASSIYGAAK